MTNETPAAKYLFLDLETTGIDDEKCQILQVAATVCDWQFEPLEGRGLARWVRNDPNNLHFEMGALKLHTDSGFLAAYTEAAGKVLTDDDSSHEGMCHPLNLIEMELMGLTSGTTKLILAGANVEGFDRRFLKRYMPDLEKRFHYRTLNTASLRECLASASEIPEDRLKVTGARPHFAPDDVVAAIYEARRIRSLLIEGLKAGGDA